LFSRVAVLAAAVAGVAACQPRSETKTETSNSAAGSPTAAAKVEISEPANGATVSRPVKVVLLATGVQIAPATDSTPGTGHHHLFLDTDVTPASDTMPRGVTGILHLGRGQTEFVLDSIKAGRHRVIAVIGDHHHRALNPMAADTVEFTVK
jgi:hypothetical protein